MFIVFFMLTSTLPQLYLILDPVFREFIKIEFIPLRLSVLGIEWLFDQVGYERSFPRLRWTDYRYF